MAGANKRPASKNKHNTAQKSDRRTREIIGIIFIAVGLCAFLTFTNLTGDFGSRISSFIYGLFGVIAYAVPIILIVYGLYTILFAERSFHATNGLLLAGIILSILAMIHVSVLSKSVVTTSKPGFLDFMMNGFYIGETTHVGGGLFGAILSYIPYYFLGKVITYILFSALFIIMVLVLTNLSLRDTGIQLSAIMADISDKLQVKWEIFQEQHAIEKAERERLHEEEIEQEKQQKIFQVQQEKEEEEERKRREIIKKEQLQKQAEQRKRQEIQERENKQKIAQQEQILQKKRMSQSQPKDAMVRQKKQEKEEEMDFDELMMGDKPKKRTNQPSSKKPKEMTDEPSIQKPKKHDDLDLFPNSGKMPRHQVMKRDELAFSDSMPVMEYKKTTSTHQPKRAISPSFADFKMEDQKKSYRTNTIKEKEQELDPALGEELIRRANRKYTANEDEMAVNQAEDLIELVEYFDEKESVVCNNEEKYVDQEEEPLDEEEYEREDDYENKLRDYEDFLPSVPTKGKKSATMAEDYNFVDELDFTVRKKKKNETIQRKQTELKKVLKQQDAMQSVDVGLNQEKLIDETKSGESMKEEVEVIHTGVSDELEVVADEQDDFEDDEGIEIDDFEEVIAEDHIFIKDEFAVDDVIEADYEIVEEDYSFPPIDLLNPVPNTHYHDDNLIEKAERLETMLQDFGIKATVMDATQGPVITRFELQPAPGIRVNRITNLSDDIALALAAPRVRIEAPIPGKSVVGIEIPNEVTSVVSFRELIESTEFINHPSKLAVALGKDIGGNVVVADIAKMPHLLVAGSTGSGKSVCINTIICSFLYHATPDEVKLIMVDPKVVELAIFSKIPHLMIPVVTDPKCAAQALQWAVREMEERYKNFAKRGARDLARYNELMEEDGLPKQPKLVIIVDELADLMMVAAKDVEEAICRIAQMGRAAGIHLILATQRPSSDIITGLIKANVPSRIAFAVASSMDSRIILDTSGADKLLGKGDMLFNPIGASQPKRVQGALVVDDEVERLRDYFEENGLEACFDSHVDAEITGAGTEKMMEGNMEDMDPLIPEIVEMFMAQGQASLSMIQRRMRVGYAKAGRLIDELEQMGIVSPSEGSKARRVLITETEFEQMFGYEPNIPDIGT